MSACLRLRRSARTSATAAARQQKPATHPAVTVKVTKAAAAAPSATCALRKGNADAVNEAVPDTEGLAVVVPEAVLDSMGENDAVELRLCVPVREIVPRPELLCDLLAGLDIVGLCDAVVVEEQLIVLL